MTPDKSQIFLNFPKFSFGEFILREIREDDGVDYFEYMNHQEVVKYLSNATLPKNLNQAYDELRYWRNLFRFGRSFYWGIALAKNNQLIGTAGYNCILFDFLRAVISYDLNYNYWGQGVMLQTLNTILNFADKKLNLIRIQATIATQHKKSIKLIEKLNFVNEGRLKNYEIINNFSEDYFMYARINDCFNKRNLI